MIQKKKDMKNSLTIELQYHYIQIYWPKITFTKTCKAIWLKTLIVYRTDKNYHYNWGFDIFILGIGFSIGGKGPYYTTESNTFLIKLGKGKYYDHR